MLHRRIFLGVVALVLVAAGFLYYQHETLAYNVVIKGKVVGQVKDGEELEKALKDYKSAKKAEVGREVSEAAPVELEKTRVNEELLADDIHSLVEKEIRLTTEAYSLSVNGESLFSLLDREDLERLLDEYKNKFLAGVDENARLESVVFKDNVEIVKEQVAVDSLITSQEAGEILATMKREAVTVEVQKGDSFWLLAREHDTTVEELIILNNHLNPEKIKPEDIVTIRPGKPLLDVIATLKNTVVEEVPYETEYQRDSSMLSRDRQVIRNGKSGKKEVEYGIVLENGYQKSLEIESEKVLEEPVTRVVKVGTREVLSRGVGRNYGVVRGRRVSSGFGWRRHPISGVRSFHEGVDIAASTGTRVYAYTSGTVSFAGWNGGYGNVVYIDHGNGIQTRYGHLSRISVSKGQKVSAGQVIGAVGNTGNSTGPHLHFEVLKYGNPQNPWNYI